MISCIITTYKREPKILKRAIMSAQAQTCPDTEIIIVNDAPESVDLEVRIRRMILDLGDEKIHYVVHDRNQGACAARNTGAKLAKGEFLAFLDDDDEWLPKKLEEQMKFMADEKVGIVGCEAYTVNKTGDISHGKLIWPDEFKNDTYALCLTGNWLGGASYPLIRKSIFFEAGQFDEKMPAFQDTDMWIRIAKISKVEMCSKPLLNYYITDNAISTNIPAKVQGVERILRKYKDEYKKHPEAFRSRLLWLGWDFMYFGKRILALRYFLLAAINGAKLEDIGRYCVRGYRSRKRALEANQIW